MPLASIAASGPAGAAIIFIDDTARDDSSGVNSAAHRNDLSASLQRNASRLIAISESTVGVNAIKYTPCYSICVYSNTHAVYSHTHPAKGILSTKLQTLPGYELLSKRFIVLEIFKLRNQTSLYMFKENRGCLIRLIECMNCR